ncbi:wd g-beta repeat-containing protein [Lichtheimia corymbifera JMRC:FSU:9682]|uniref:Wd g-beta repeat-containing protein n=1 Tax=Lichtheimia corymbifera JMRC:FSU:9682 TaxID=1263082 RepID=A0A068S2I8_9FUNG|nr:wd g-beta repeat-containing protein [Lichtheimia corymbifera JMRC:FSU:9682]
MAETSDQENNTAIANQEPIKDAHADDHKDMDDIDTDDLLDEAELSLKSTHWTASKTTTTSSRRKGKGAATSTTTTSRRRKGAAKSTEDMDIDDSESETGGSNKRSSRSKKAKGKQKPKVVAFDPEYTKKLAQEYPDPYWKFHADAGYQMIDKVNDEATLEALPYNVSDQAAIIGMTLSADGTMLATFSNIGAVKIWDVENEFKLIQKLRDPDEKNIDEFYCGQFTSDMQDHIVTGGKLKDRHRWSAEDEDNHILPCPIKIFNLESSKVVARLEGHEEEILTIKDVKFKGENYYISTSQDGYIIKWKMESDWTTLVESTRMDDGETCMAFTVSFVPHTGNKYFVGACDEHLRLYDFEEAKLLQTFESIYSSYCDCGKFIKWVDEPAYKEAQAKATAAVKTEEEEEINVEKMDEDNNNNNTASNEEYAWFISRGAEMCDVEDGVSSIPNTCTLHKLVYPTEQGGKFKMEEVKRYKHEDYHANSWLVKIASNGRYIVAPTIYGQLFVFNMLTEQLTGIVKEHQDVEVRDVLFHPYRPLVFSSGDDGYVKIYSYKSMNKEEQAEELDVGNSS